MVLYYRLLMFSACVCAKLCKPCLTLCNPPGSSVHGILQARILEWVDVPSSRNAVCLLNSRLICEFYDDDLYAFTLEYRYCSSRFFFNLVFAMICSFFYSFYKPFLGWITESWNTSSRLLVYAFPSEPIFLFDDIFFLT